MTKFTDQHLSAFIDGELSEALTRDIRIALEQDEALASRLQALERANEEFLSAHQDVADEPIPQRFLDILDRADSSPELDSTVVNFPGSTNRVRAWLMPLAACLVLAIGVAFGTRLNTGNVSESSDMILAGPVNADSDLHQVLETAPSGKSENGITAILTFATDEGGYCRELTTETTRALACRDPQAERWTLLAVAAQQAQSDDTAYYPASASGTATIGSLVDQLINGIPMTQQEEVSLISDGWRRRPERNSRE